MNGSRSLAALPLLLLFVASAHGQSATNPVQIHYVYPAGGRQGTTFEVEVGSVVPIRAVAVHISGSGVESTPVVISDAQSKQKDKEVAEELQRLSKEKQDPEVAHRLAELRLKTAIQQGRRGKAGKDAKKFFVAVVNVTVAPGAEIGQRELRIETAGGLSNPLPFHIGKLPELSKAEVAIDLAGGKGGPPTLPPDFTHLLINDTVRRGQAPPSRFTVPVTINGQIFPGQADRFRFEARKGQQLVIVASARELMRYIADGSPGWFQAALALYDASGREVAYSDCYRFRQDPLILYKVATDGEYVLEIRDTLYRGRSDFVYRVSVSEQPLITGMFPLGGRAGTKTTVRLDGWNLPVTKSTLDAAGKGPGVEYVTVTNKDGLSDRRPFAVDTLPECVEKEPNNVPDTAQAIKLPIIVNGRIDPPGDRDVFRFDGKAGQEIVAEVIARRLDSPLDSLLKLTDAKGKLLALNDDYLDKAAGLRTHHADSYIRTTLPADGAYCIHLTDTQDKGGPEYAYRLRVGPPRPDFELRVDPSSVYARPGKMVPITVHVVGRDGFTGPVDVALKDAPDGFTLSNNVYVSPKAPDLIRLSLFVPPRPLEDSVKLALEGCAPIEGRKVAHPCVPADVMEQAFGASWHVVPAEDCLATVREPPPPAQPAAPSKPPPPPPTPIIGPLPPRNSEGWTMLSPTPLILPIEAAVQIRFQRSHGIPSTMMFDLKEPLPGITVKTVSIESKEVVFELVSDPATGSRPGVKGDLTIGIFRSRRRPTGELPPIPFEIVVPASAEK